MSSPAVVVAGLDPLGVLVAEELARAGLRITALADDAERRRYGERLAAVDVHVVPAMAPWSDDLTRVAVEASNLLVLCADDDGANVDAALAARARAPGLPVLVRIADPALERFVRDSMSGVEVFSMASVAAPTVANLAVERLATRPRGGWPHVIVASRQMLRGVMPRPSALFWSVFVAFLAMLLPASYFFSESLGLSYFDAVYFVWTTVLSVGYGDISLKESTPLAKAVGMAVMLFGAAFTAAMVGLMADWLLTRRLGSLFVRVAVRMSDHVVVCGAGSFGVQIAELLRARGLRVVVIEAAPDAPSVQRLRAQGIPVVIGDATLDDTLDLASAYSAGVVLAMTNHDAVNLHLGLRLQEESPPVPVVARVRSRLIARHVDEHCGFAAISPLLSATAHVVRRVHALAVGARPESD